jgi:hypothetical protein
MEDEKMQYELKVKKIKKDVVDTEDLDNATKYKMVASNSMGGQKVTFEQDEPFVGFRPKQTLVIKVDNPQKTIAESVKDDGPLGQPKVEKNNVDFGKVKKKKSRVVVTVVKRKKN